MTALFEQKCVACDGSVPPLTSAEATALGKELHDDWKIAADVKSLRRSFKFKDFYRTMSFVNAIAYIANIEDHHPDLELGYNYCHVAFSTHAIGGLSLNDFIAATKIDRLV